VYLFSILVSRKKGSLINTLKKKMKICRRLTLDFEQINPAFKGVSTAIQRFKVKATVVKTDPVDKVKVKGSMTADIGII
jgi:hypothetical protein